MPSGVDGTNKGFTGETNHRALLARSCEEGCLSSLTRVPTPQLVWCIIVRSGTVSTIMDIPTGDGALSQRQPESNVWHGCDEKMTDQARYRSWICLLPVDFCILPGGKGGMRVGVHLLIPGNARHNHAPS
ncbi:hypothetical protein BaRGS_00012194 [Batillaria attramentaria]|uniref:Uncharacterized protein n=1 Tax=Batillaria attramentaria TaxID=370345 RepID=A0ABD0LC41_9CAEN